MIINGVKTAMNRLPEAIANINALDDSERSCHDKSEIIEYVMDTLLQEYMETHNKIHEGVGYSRAKQLLNELSEDL